MKGFTQLVKGILYISNVIILGRLNQAIVQISNVTISCSLLKLLVRGWIGYELEEKVKKPKFCDYLISQVVQ